MRLISHGAICAVNAREQRRLDKFRAAQERKRNEEAKKPRKDHGAEPLRSAVQHEQTRNAAQMRVTVD